MRTEIRLAGFGGQGIVLAGYILGKAAALYDDKEAIFTQSYGPEARGGACAAELVVDDEPIDYPRVQTPDILVLMSQEAADKYGHQVKDGTTVIVEASLVEGAAPEWPAIAATQIAEDLGARISANIVMLGFLLGVTKVVNREALEEAVMTSVPQRSVELNLKALTAGYRQALQLAEAAV